MLHFIILFANSFCKVGPSFCELRFNLLIISGTQFKVIVEYAPSQRVPKQWSKKDGREGTIGKGNRGLSSMQSMIANSLPNLSLTASCFDELVDPEYLEFLESVSKPVENLPSAEIQLERKEAERAGQPQNFSNTFFS